MQRYPDEGPFALAEELNRSVISVRNKANKLGLMRTEKPAGDDVIGRLIRARRHKKLTMGDVGDFVGRHRKTVWMWETRRRSPTLDDLTRWADFFDLDLTVKKKKNLWELGK